MGEALRASGERQRNTILLFTLDLRGEALVVEVTGAARLHRAASVWTAGLAAGTCNSTRAIYNKVLFQLATIHNANPKTIN